MRSQSLPVYALYCTAGQVLTYSALASSGNADTKTVASDASQDLSILRFLVWVGFPLSIVKNNFILVIQCDICLLPA